MEPGLIASYRSAEAVARSRSNFYYSFIVLPAEKRRAFCAVYAFMRYCDDISDGDAGIKDKRIQLQNWRLQLQAAYSGKIQDDPILPAFRDTVHKFSIPEQYFHWIIDGEEMDLEIFQYERFEDLYKYCFRVASAVGLVCLHIFGFREERAKIFAEQCGVAFQLTNILRDIKEDSERGRIYLPLEDLKQFKYTEEELRRGVQDERFRQFMSFEAERAREYYRGARNLLPLIEESSRPALWAMMEIYERILNRIIEQRFDVFQHRIRLTAREKAFVAFKAITIRFANRIGLGIPCS
jgi:phytoene synthase